MCIVHIDYGPLVREGVGARREDGNSLSYTYYIGFIKIATLFVEIEAIFSKINDMKWWRFSVK